MRYSTGVVKNISLESAAFTVDDNPCSS